MAATLFDHQNAIDLTKIREKKIRNRILHVGIELEGGWDTLPAGTRPIMDGSVRDHPPDGRYLGEIPSPPIAPDDVEKWIKTYHPHHVNTYCGLHVHMSFRNPFVYQRLMTPAYPATIVEELRKWANGILPRDHHIWDRLNGENIYCQHVFFADEQIQNRQKDFNQTRNGHRYTVINYCYNVHNTLECRILPMLPTPQESYRAVKEVMDITNAFLASTAKREPKMFSSFVGDEDEVVLERHIHV